MAKETGLGYVSILPRFEYLTPRTLDQACSLLAQHEGKAKVLAGGTDLLVSMKQRSVNPQYLVSIRNIPLDFVEFHPNDGLRIGARASLQTVSDSPVVREKFSLLATACDKVGSLQIKNMGTLGGNICNAGPSQDTIPPLLALDARLKLVSVSGERTVPVEAFLTGPFQTVLQSTEILTEVLVPNPPPRTAGDYQWFTKMAAKGETLVGAAALLTLDDSKERCYDIRVGLGSVAPTPFRAKRAEEVLRGRVLDSDVIRTAARTAAEEILPRSRSVYRCKLTSLLVERVVNQAWRTAKQQDDSRHG